MGFPPADDSSVEIFSSQPEHSSMHYVLCFREFTIHSRDWGLTHSLLDSAYIKALCGFPYDAKSD